MGGLEWAALDVVCDVLGVEDVETLIAQLIVLRNTPDKLGN